LIAGPGDFVERPLHSEPEMSCIIAGVLVRELDEVARPAIKDGTSRARCFHRLRASRRFGFMAERRLAGSSSTL